MDKGLLHKYTSRLETEVQAGSLLDLDATEDCGCFGYLRGLRERAVMLELRKRNGNILAIAYAWIDRIEFNPSEGIRIASGTGSVRIHGKNLAGAAPGGMSLVEAIILQRVAWISEARDVFDEGEVPTVSGISW